MSTTVNHHRHRTDVAVIMVPLPAQSHLHQHLLLARHLATTFRLPVHYVGSTLHNRQACHRLLSWDPPPTAIQNSMSKKTPVNIGSESQNSSPLTTINLVHEMTPVKAGSGSRDAPSLTKPVPENAPVKAGSRFGDPSSAAATTTRSPVSKKALTKAQSGPPNPQPPPTNPVPEKTPANAESVSQDPPHLPNTITFHNFNLPNPSSPNPNPNLNFPAHLQPMLDSTHYLHRPFADLLISISKEFRRVIVIHDRLMASVVQHVKLIENAESYVLCTISAFSLLKSRYISIEEKPFKIEQIGVLSEFQIPSHEGSVTEEFAKFSENELKILDFSSGTIYSTNMAIEGTFVDLIGKLPINGGKRQFAVGPLQPMVIKERSKSAVIEWLEKQEGDSVLYVSFGTTTSFRKEQITEIAIGLERSQHKFVWVLRDADRIDIFSHEETRRAELPEGYEDRIQERGIIVRDWAPQLEILAHPATRGFMSHCGWNSCLESLSMGVPILTWPMHSDQPNNAFLVTNVLKAGVNIRDWAHKDKLVTASDIEIAVKQLMGSQEGDDIRKRVVQLGRVVRDSVAEGGASRLEMESFVAHITR